MAKKYLKENNRSEVNKVWELELKLVLDSSVMFLLHKYNENYIVFLYPKQGIYGMAYYL